MMNSLVDTLKDGAVGDLLPWAVQSDAASRYSLSLGDVELLALQNCLTPSRYQRNRKTISVEQQLSLFESVVAVVGCGGLGGYVLEECARLGVGHIVAIDPDCFTEHNLNRQILSTFKTLGQPKVEAARRRIAEINPAVSVSAVKEALTEENGAALLEGADVVIDGLDSISARRILARTCSSLSIPLVHGAIGGWYGHVLVQFPGERTIEELYGSTKSDTGAESWLGNPAFTPAVISSLQVAMTCRLIISGNKDPEPGRLYSINLKDMELFTLRLR
ncbi:MAG: ThiF family adenylyltransferase [Vulcanimicrobiota bacterium]